MHGRWDGEPLMLFQSQRSQLSKLSNVLQPLRVALPSVQLALFAMVLGLTFLLMLMVLLPNV